MVDSMTAVINSFGEVTLAYIAESRKFSSNDWQVASMAQFQKGHDLDDLLGIDGDGLSEDDEIICSDGIIKGFEVL